MSATPNLWATVQRLIDKALAGYCPHRVGELYISMTDADPSKTWPGTSWERITDCFLRAADDKHPAGTTGGAWTHTQTIYEMPMHSHRIPSVNNGSFTVAPYGAIFSNLEPLKYNVLGKETSENHNGWAIAYEGYGHAMDITNKYTAVNIWRRTA